MEHSSEVKQPTSGFEPAPNYKGDPRYGEFVKAFDECIPSIAKELAKDAPYSKNVYLLHDGSVRIPSVKEESSFVESGYSKLPKVGGGISKTYFRLSDDEVMAIPTSLRNAFKVPSGNVLENIVRMTPPPIRKCINDWLEILFYEKYYSDRARAAGLVSQQINIQLLTIGNVQIPVIVSPSFEKLCRKDGWNIFDNYGSHFAHEESELFKDLTRDGYSCVYIPTEIANALKPILSHLVGDVETAMKNAIPLGVDMVNVAILPRPSAKGIQTIRNEPLSLEAHTPRIFFYDFGKIAEVASVRGINGGRSQASSLQMLFGLESTSCNGASPTAVEPIIVQIVQNLATGVLEDVPLGIESGVGQITKTFADLTVSKLGEFSKNLTSKQRREMHSIPSLHDVAFHILIKTLGNDPSNIFGSLKEVRVSPQASGVLESPELTFQSHAPSASLETQLGELSASESSNAKIDHSTMAKHSGSYSEFPILGSSSSEFDRLAAAKKPRLSDPEGEMHVTSSALHQPHANSSTHEEPEALEHGNPWCTLL